MASLRQRGNNYYVVFTRRIDGDLKQKSYSLRTDSKREAERLKFELEDRYRRGDIHPFGPFDIGEELQRRRRKSLNGMALEDVGRAFLKSRSHVAEATYHNYERRLDRLYDEIGRTMPVRCIREEDIREFCFRSRYSNATQRTYLRFCRMLFKWMQEESYVEESVARRVRYPRKKDNISDKTITEQQLAVLLRAHKGVQRPKILKGQKRGLHVWFRPLVALGFYSGMRRGEIMRLTWDKVDLDAGFIEVTDTKPGRERVVPIQQNLMPYLEAWHRLCGRPSGGLVFCKADMGDWQIPLNKDHVTQVFKKYVRAAGLPDTVNFHGLRHSCATYLLRKGMDISAVGKILGHESPSTTKIYEHLNPNDIQKRMRELGL